MLYNNAMLRKISDFFDAVCIMFAYSYTWKQARDIVKKIQSSDEDRDTSIRIFRYFRIMNEVPGLKVWMEEDSIFHIVPSAYTLIITFENKGKLDNKIKNFCNRKELLAFMETKLGGMTLYANGKSFTFPAFKTPSELAMKLKLQGTISL